MSVSFSIARRLGKVSIGISIWHYRGSPKDAFPFAEDEGTPEEYIIELGLLLFSLCAVITGRIPKA